MLRTLLPCALVVAACSNNPSTGPASLMSCTSSTPISSCNNGTTTAKSAWIEPTHVGYTVNGMPMNYLGWLLNYTTVTPGTECTNDLMAVTKIKIITTQVESATATRAMLMPEQVPIVSATPDQPPSVDVAVVSTSDQTALFTSGTLTIAADMVIDKNGNGEIDGSINASGSFSGGDIDITGDFYAHKCFL